MALFAMAYHEDVVLVLVLVILARLLLAVVSDTITAFYGWEVIDC